jgi:hypothetical protein
VSSAQLVGDAKSENESGPAVPVGGWGKFKRWYTVAAVGLLSSVLLVLLLNLILYAIVRSRKAASAEAPQISFDPVRLHKAYPGWREEDVRTLLLETVREKEYEPFTGFRETPFRGKFVNIDPAGFRVSKDQAPWPPSPTAINVFVFGGSTAFGAALPDDETITSYLQQAAASDHASPPMAFYNFARPAYFSSQELVLFEQLLRAGFVPQVAVFVDGLNDFIFANGQPLFTDRLANFMAGRSESSALDDVPMFRAAHWLSERWKKPKSQTQETASYDDPALLQGAVDRWLANKRVIELIAQGFGVRAVFVWQPVPVYKYDLRYHFFLHSSSEFAAYGRSGYGYPLMENLRARGTLGSDVLWLADMQQNKRENLYVDSIHYNAAFSKEIAGQIYAFLRQSSPKGASGPAATGRGPLAQASTQEALQGGR